MSKRGRVRRLRDEALESAGLAANPPQSVVFDRPAGRGPQLSHRQGQKRAFDETKGLRAKGFERRAGNLLPEDQRRMASLFSVNVRFSNSFDEGGFAIDTTLERRAPSRGAVSLRSPAHLPQAFHQSATQI